MQQPGLALPTPTDNPNLGSKHRGVYDAVGRRVPLPAGEFEVMAFNLVKVGRADSITAALAQIDGQRLAAVVLVFASPVSVKLETGMRAIPLCERTDIHYKEVTANVDFENQDCLVVTHIWPEGFRGRDASNVIKSLVTAMDTRGLPLPPALVNAYFNYADRDGYLRVTYFFNPEIRGITSRPTATWHDSEWHMNYLARDVRKLEYMDDLKQWARLWRPYMQKAFNGTLQTLPPQNVVAAMR